MTKITNLTKRLEGVVTGHGRVYLRPGESRELEFTDDALNRVRRLTGVLLVDGDPLQSSGTFTGSVGGPGTPGGKPEPSDASSGSGAVSLGPIPEDRDELKAYAEKLGLDFDTRIPTARLREMVEEKVASSD